MGSVQLCEAQLAVHLTHKMKAFVAVAATIAAAEAGSIGLATPWAGYNYAGIAAGAPAPIAAAPAAWAAPAIAAAPAWAGAAIAPAPLAINPLGYAGQLYPAAEPYLHDLAGEAYPEAEAYVH